MRRADQGTLAVLWFVTLLGLAIRLAVVAPAGFPLNDGGLFYTMIGNLLTDHLRLPVFTTYNAASIPFAYPPLAFYLYAVLNLTTHVSVLRLMQFVPAFISAASIPVFYFLAYDLLKSKSQAALAMLVFALLPRAFDWSIMGGGVTRSLGMLFALLAMRQAYRLFTTGLPAAILPMIILGSLVAYTHPEAATHTAASAALFYLWQDRSRRGLLNAALTAVGILALTSPWWATVVTRHGLDPFLAAASAARQDSYNFLVGLFALFRFEFADEPFVSILTVLGLVGIFVELASGRYLLPLWLLVMHTFEPRGGILFMMIPLAICAGLALGKVLLPFMGGRDSEPPTEPGRELETSSDWLEKPLQGRMARIFLGFVLIYGIMSAYATGWRIVQEFTLTGSDLQALAWTRANTAPESKFALVTQGLPLRDASSEWFPALTGRQSVATVFGFEWIRGRSFSARIDRYQSLQACAEKGVSCLADWRQNQGQDFDYVYIRDPAGIRAMPLAVVLSESPDYQAVYTSETVVILQLR